MKFRVDGINGQVPNKANVWAVVIGLGFLGVVPRNDGVGVQAADQGGRYSILIGLILAAKQGLVQNREANVHLAKVSTGRQPMSP